MDKNMEFPNSPEERKEEARTAVPEEAASTKLKEEKKTSRKEDLISTLRDLSYMLAAMVLLFLFFFRIAVVNGSSMVPTLYNGDRLLMLSSFLYPHYQAGDVVVIHERGFEDQYNLVKRVIATEGQTVDIDFNEGIVYLDGVPQQEPYVNTPTNLDEGMVFPVTVPEGCVFAMGDNRNNSKDSRDPEVGFIDQREIFGKAVVLFFPGPTKDTDKRDFTRIGAVK